MQERVLSISTAGVETTLPQAPVRGLVVKSKWARNFLVVHPLDDRPEEKVDTTSLEPMPKG